MKLHESDNRGGIVVKLIQRALAHKINMQWLEMGIWGEHRGWDKVEECLGVNGRHLFVRVD